ncbi:uncharacterized protein [Dermacentor albipictus]|uniref:uncharacterized protein n=1 Tax=Dermacentor albipictus TaxID=60249 RepID=UPI0038FCA7B3
MAILSRCCFVCSIRDGALVIGITCIVCRVLASVACVVLLTSYAHEHGAEPGGTLRYNMTSLKLLLPDNLLVVLFSGFLVIGLVKNRRYYLIPWIVWVSASCIILIILWCLRAIIAIKDQVLTDIALLGAALVLFSLQVYFILVVLSHYQNMKNSSRQLSVVIKM